MFPFFRKIRYRLAKDNQFLKYSRYAIGEIVLVVIGILIALYINNWNEQRKEHDKFDKVLVEVEAELITNLFQSRDVLHDYFFRQDSIANLILFEELTHDDYRRSPELGTFTLSNYLPYIRTEAYPKLLENNSVLSPIQDSIREALKQLYGVKDEIISGGQRMSVLARRHRKDYKKFSWYNDWLAGIQNEDRVEYLVNNSEYKKDVGEYISEQMDFLRPDIEYFETEGCQIYKRIFDYLEANMIKHEDSLYFQYISEDFKHYVGTYVETDRTNTNMVVIDSTTIIIEDDKLFYIPYLEDGSSHKREIIPISKYNFRTEFGRGFYRLTFDENDNVIAHIWSNGMGRRKSIKIR